MIGQETEKREVAETGHKYQCFEINAERLIEDGDAETGAWDEILDRKGYRLLIDVFCEIVTEHPDRCECTAQPTAEEAEEADRWEAAMEADRLADLAA